jgi:hypothetical protein
LQPGAGFLWALNLVGTDTAHLQSLGASRQRRIGRPAGHVARASTRAGGRVRADLLRLRREDAGFRAQRYHAVHVCTGCCMRFTQRTGSAKNSMTCRISRSFRLQAEGIPLTRSFRLQAEGNSIKALH